MEKFGVLFPKLGKRGSVYHNSGDNYYFMHELLISSLSNNLFPHLPKVDRDLARACRPGRDFPRLH
jgi:hypothetical protein